MGATFCPLKSVVSDPSRGRLLTFLHCVAWVTVPGFPGIYSRRVLFSRVVINTGVVDCSRPFRIKWSVSSPSDFAAKFWNQIPTVGLLYHAQSEPLISRPGSHINIRPSSSRNLLRFKNSQIFCHFLRALNLQTPKPSRPKTFDPPSLLQDSSVHRNLGKYRLLLQFFSSYSCTT